MKITKNKKQRKQIRIRLNTQVCRYLLVLRDNFNKGNTERHIMNA